VTLLDHIPEGATVALDTVAWVYVFDPHPLYGPVLRPLFDGRFATGRNRAGASVLALGELFVQPLSLGRADVAGQYRRFFADPARVAVWDVTPAVAERAADLRARFGVKLLDALHVAAAACHGAAVFVTNDHGLRRITDIPILMLDDYLPPATPAPPVP
jgi:predicted nucleic acid-binding protein